MYDGCVSCRKRAARLGYLPCGAALPSQLVRRRDRVRWKPASIANAALPDASYPKFDDGGDLDSNPLPRIPWTFQKIGEVMALWIVHFFIVGSSVQAILPILLGISSTSLSTCGHALSYLMSDFANLLLTIFIVTQSVRPHQFWNMGLFTIRPSSQMVKVVLFCCLTFPVIDIVSRLGQCWWIQVPDSLSLRLEHSLSRGDIIANCMYAFVVTVLTPVWEETIFRGFLLLSLTRYMPTAAAILVSSIAFTAAHFSIQRSAYLVLLGCVIGYSFIRTRNLLAPIFVHAFWNLYVFLRVVFYPATMAFTMT